MGDEVLELTEVPEIVERIARYANGITAPGRFENALNFRPGPEYVCLSSGIKSGTTWTQQIMHGLRSGGDMSFDEIDEVVSNLEYSPDVDVCEDQPFNPQMYKTHFHHGLCPKGFSKYIVLTRDPRDAALSLYLFHCNWFFTEEELSADDFVKYFVANRIPEEYAGINALQLNHQASWYPHRKDENVLWLHYEDLKQDLKACVKLISDFLGIGVGDQKLLELVEKQAGFDFMKKHQHKFDEHLLKLGRNEAIGLPKTAGLCNKSTSKVRNGNVHDGKRFLSAKSIAAIEAKWRSLFAPMCDYVSYEEMRAGINKELGRTFKEE